MTISEFNNIRQWLSEVVDTSPFSGHVYIVGGAVRDYILGHEIKDIDLVIDIPEGGVKFAEWMEGNGYTHGTVITYPTYGTAMFRPSEFPDVELECVQTRGEQYHDKNSRNPETHFASIEEDAFRRDFTCNALYINLSDTKILDITGKGIDDMNRHIIRVTNDNPDIVFEDDPLRTLRGISRAVRLGWEIEPETYAAIKRNASRLQIISKERIQDEFVKILLSPDPKKGMEMLKDTGLLEQFIPEFKATYSMKQNVYHDYCTVWEHTMKVVHHAGEMNQCKGKEKTILMLGAVLHDIGKVRTYTVKDGNVHFYGHEMESEKMAETILRRLKFPNDIISEVKFIVRNHMRFKGIGEKVPKDKTVRKFQYECKDIWRFGLALYLMHADNLSHGEHHCLPTQAIGILNRSSELVADGSAMFGYKPPIDGNDIMTFKGIGPCREVKKYQEHLIKLAFNNPKALDADACYKAIKNIDPSRI